VNADLARYARAGVREAEVVARSKGEIVLADAGYGASAAFRHELRAVLL